MTKIWEVDFTSYSGASVVALDNVGTQHLVTSTGIVKASLQEFALRSGVSFTRNSTQQYYGLNSAGVTNALWKSSYTQRSFVMWSWVRDPYNNTYWDDSSSFQNLIWAGYTSGGNVADGFGVRPNNGASPGSATAALVLNGGTIYTAGTVTEGWHLWVCTIDKGAIQSKFYFDGELITTLPDQPSTSASTSDTRIGDKSNSFEGTYQLGYMATYDHILTQSEVTTIYNTFLKDAPSGTPYNSFSGTVFGLNNLPISGCQVYLLNTDINRLEYITSTNGSGAYQVQVSSSGNYLLTTSSGLLGGSQSITLTSTSGGVTFG